MDFIEDNSLLHSNCLPVPIVIENWTAELC